MLHKTIENIRNVILSLKIIVETDPTFMKIKDRLKSDKRIVLLRWKLAGIHPYLARNFFQLSAFLIVLFLLFICMYGFFWRAPRPFPEHIIVSVGNGESLGAIAKDFEEQNVVVSSFWLRAFIFLRGGQGNVIAGDYYIPKAKSVFGIANIITNGDFGLTPIKILIPGGLNAREMASLIKSIIPRFDTESFIEKGTENEGYLFPDTYYFMLNESPDLAISIMRENFARKIEQYLPDVEKFQKPLSDDIIVASILEDEANTIEDKRIVAGIIWKRLKLKMPLQLDSTLRYVSGKASNEITKVELEDDDNPYNTYANKGLPPTPISNPGLDSIRAAITPTNTKYLYFLSDRNGNMHYAETFEQHKNNRTLYLNK